MKQQLAELERQHAAQIGKKQYKFGDLTKKIISDLKPKKDKNQFN